MSVIPCILLENSLPKKHQEFFPGHSTVTPNELKFIRSLAPLIGQIKHLANMDRMTKQSHVGKDGFVVRLNVENFKPEEVTVKTVNDSIVIEAKCERKSEHEYVSSQYRRRYELPDGFRAEDVVSTMSSDGILTIKCPKTQIDKARQIEIKQTGPVRPTADGNEPSTEEGQEQPAERYQCRMF